MLSPVESLIVLIRLPRAIGKVLWISTIAAATCMGVVTAQSMTAASPQLHEAAIEFICGAEHRAPVTGPRRLSIESGMGSGGFAIRTSDPEAQAWFNYGLKLFHAFYIEDSKVAFDKAAEHDPACVLCLWGQALSHGSFQNLDVNSDELKTALDYARKAQALATTPVEQALTVALTARYVGKQDAKIEIDFASSLQAAQALDPEALDIGLIASEALLTAARRGDFSAAGRAVAILEPILARDPNNTAAIHYYIHATAWTGQTARTEPYAERLVDLAPKASHLVHMAGHTFFNLGRYEDAGIVNARALLVDAEHSEATGLTGPLGTPVYYPHNLTYGLDAALMAGDAALALKFARDAEFAFDGTLPDSRAGSLRYAYIAFARFVPDEMLRMPAESAPFLDLMRLYARGEAFATKHDVAALAREERTLRSRILPRPKDWTIEVTLPLIADKVLKGRIAMLRGEPGKAVRSFKEAAALQDSHASREEPPAWWYPVRRSLAAAYYQSGHYGEAATEALTSLQARPKDGLALLVLSRVEERLGQIELARQHRDQAAKAWLGNLDEVDIATI
jgi:tetratricopeptide (TPR) repeat protein